eukprot:m.1234281 g.1234281  ORF g.1234281 m.1234281 type:complete len:1427 (-) comp24665_c0_seq11:370-4650(-)
MMGSGLETVSRLAMSKTNTFVSAAVLLQMLCTTGCVFDCRTHEYCGPPQSNLGYKTFISPTGTFSDLSQVGNLSLFVNSVLDLSHRGISKIAAGGLFCGNYTFYECVETTNDGACARNVSKWVGYQDIFGLNLDGNALVSVPDISTFGNVQFLSLNNNQITSADLRGFSAVNGTPTKDSLYIYLNNNSITTVKENAFSDVEVADHFYISLEGNAITALEPGFLGACAGYSVTVNVNYNALTALPPYGFAGCLFCQYLRLFADHNQISNLSDTFAAGAGYTDGLMLISLNNNRLTSVPVPFISNVRSAQFNFYVNSNAITTLPPNFIGHCRADYVIVSAMDNLLTEFAANTCGAFAGLRLYLYVNNNRISRLAPASLNASVLDEVYIYFDGNNITDIEPTSFSTFKGPLMLVSFVDNAVTTMATRAFALFQGRELIVLLKNNSITSLGSAVFGGFQGRETQLSVFLNNNNISAVDDSVFDGFGGYYLQLIFNGNNVSVLSPTLFASFPGTGLLIDFTANQIEAVEAAMFDNFQGTILQCNFAENRITALGSSLLAGFTGTQLIVNVSRNSIVQTEGIFHNFTAAGNCILDLTHNLLTAASVVAIMQSFTSSAASVVVDVSSNRIEQVPSHLFANIAVDTSIAIRPQVSLLMRDNPLRNFSAAAFDAGTLGNYLGPLLLDISSNGTGGAGSRVEMPPMLSFNGWHGSSELTVVLQGVSVGDIAALNAFRSFPGVGLDIDASNGNVSVVPADLLQGVSFAVTLNLSNNQISFLPPSSFQFQGSVDLSHNDLSGIANGTFHNSPVRALNLSNNRITVFASSAFAYTFSLVDLDVSNNALSVLRVAMLSTMPALGKFAVQGNRIYALPLSSNHMQGSWARGDTNLLGCDAYGPRLNGCVCPPGYVYSEHCSYGRCLTTMSGCVPPLRHNTSSCAAQPLSDCIAGCADGYFLRGASCEPVTECTTAYPTTLDNTSNSSNIRTSYLRAYEYQPPTTTSDRRCSICSTCNAGYTTHACTPTTDTACTAQFRLVPGDIAAIVLASVLFVAALVLGTWYGRRQQQKRKQARFDLEQTELLLSDITEKHDRMQQAWAISEDDLVLDRQLASGTYGTVWAGYWGHIPVAVKRLKIPLDDLDPVSADDFEKEVTSMQSIRHPNLLSFYGAGVTHCGMAFLVVELMARGSMRSLLKDKQKTLPWTLRMSIAVDIARGMNHLHGLLIVHRDLKSDNCLIDEHCHAKVADFGNSRLMSEFRKQQKQQVVAETRLYKGPDGAHVAPAQLPARMTTGVGTPLWMAPELLRGDSEYGPSIDVYSYGIMLWEIWARRDPWEDIVANDYLAFWTLLETAVTSGQRPPLPTRQHASTVLYDYAASDGDRGVHLWGMLIGCVLSTGVCVQGGEARRRGSGVLVLQWVPVRGGTLVSSFHICVVSGVIAR